MPVAFDIITQFLFCIGIVHEIQFELQKPPRTTQISKVSNYESMMSKIALYSTA